MKNRYIPFMEWCLLIKVLRRVRCVGFYFVLLFLLTGCGTTKWSDTSRTATEQLLISNAIDDATNKIDFSPLSGKKCFLKFDAIDQNVDHKYLAATIRQQVAAVGAILSAKEEDADYVVEVRSGGVGTDRDDILFGIPAVSVPAVPGIPSGGTMIPEVPIIKRTKQKGVAKIALFAYNRRTGMAMWSSGNTRGEGNARNLWFAGSGPLTKGSVYKETTFAGGKLPWTAQPEKSGSWIDTPHIFETPQNSETMTAQPKQQPKY